MPKKGLMARINVFETVGLIGFLTTIAVSFQVISLSVMGSSIGDVAPYLALIFLFGGYVAGEVRDLQDLADYEIITLVSTTILIIGSKWIPEVQDLISSNQVYGLVFSGVATLGFLFIALRRS